MSGVASVTNQPARTWGKIRLGKRKKGRGIKKEEKEKNKVVRETIKERRKRLKADQKERAGRKDDKGNRDRPKRED